MTTCKNIHTIATIRKLTSNKEKELNNVDGEISTIVLKPEKA